MSKEVFVPKEIKEIPGVLRIGVDLDANVVDLFTPARLLIMEELGVDIGSGGSVNFYIQQRPEIREVPGGSAFVTKIFEEPLVYEQAKLVAGAVEILNRWRDQSHQIWFITARPRELVGQVTLDWLGKNNLSWAKDGLLFRQTSEGDRVRFKTHQAQRLGLHIFIEDHAETIKAVTSDSMMAKLVLKYPWNIAEDIGSQARFVKNWLEIDEIVQDASRWHYFLHI